MSSLLRATNLWGYADLVRQLGGDPAPLLGRHRIRPGVEHVEDAFVSFSAFSRMLEATAEELDCPDFGLRLAAWQGLDILGPVAVIARNAQTVRAAFEEIARYLYVHSPALRLTEAQPGAPGVRPGGHTFHFTVVEPGLPYPPQAYELSLANGNRILRLLAGEDARARRVSFLHPRVGPVSSYEETFGTDVRFGQPWCGMELADELAEHEVDNADPETRRLVSRYLTASYLPEDAGLAPRVAELVRRLLPTGQCSAAAVADELGVHPRTLQRRLADEGTTFWAVADAERKEQAARLLAEPGLQLRQVAGLLGYAEQSTFNRSFQRWYGTSPARHRRG
ncbi:MAG: AraC family transcriptional regulator [Nocardioidaceae bacterium]|nr:AraC family transcriptional regulator [Nocardioidaceae bacterium]